MRVFPGCLDLFKFRKKTLRYNSMPGQVSGDDEKM